MQASGLFHLNGAPKLSPGKSRSGVLVDSVDRIVGRIPGAVDDHERVPVGERTLLAPRHCPVRDAPMDQHDARAGAQELNVQEC